MKNNKELQELALFVHGILFGLHSLGFVYNLKRRNWFDVLVHGTAAGYDLYAVRRHYLAVKEAI